MLLSKCAYTRGGEEGGEKKKKDTHTHPTQKVIKQIHTHACPYIHTSPHRSSALFLRSSVKKNWYTITWIIQTNELFCNKPDCAQEGKLQILGLTKKGICIHWPHRYYTHTLRAFTCLISTESYLYSLLSRLVKPRKWVTDGIFTQLHKAKGGGCTQSREPSSDSAKHAAFHIPSGVVLRFESHSRTHHLVQGWLVLLPYLTASCCGTHLYLPGNCHTWNKWNTEWIVLLCLYNMSQCQQISTVLFERSNF